MSVGSNSSLSQEYSELEKKFSLQKDKLSLLEDQCDMLKQEKEDLQSQVNSQTIVRSNIHHKKVLKA